MSILNPVFLPDLSCSAVCYSTQIFSLLPWKVFFFKPASKLHLALFTWLFVLMFAWAGRTSRAAESGFYRGGWSHSGDTQTTECSKNHAQRQVKMWLPEVRQQSGSIFFPSDPVHLQSSACIYIFLRMLPLRNKHNTVSSVILNWIAEVSGASKTMVINVLMFLRSHRIFSYKV